MKRLQYLLMVALGAIAFTCWSWQLPTTFSQPAHSTEPAQELSQNVTTPFSDQPVQQNQVAPDNILPGGGDVTPSLIPRAMLLEGDQLYRQGERIEAEKIYRQAKPEFEAVSVPEVPEPIYEEDELDTEILEQWKTAQQAIENSDKEGAIQMLRQVVEQKPGFIPAQVKLAEMLNEDGDEDEAIALLEELVTFYPNSAEVVMALVRTLSDDGKHLESAIAAREFSILNLDHPQAEEFKNIAKEEFDKFSSAQKRRSIFGGVVNIVTGIVTGKPPWESWNSATEAISIVQLMMADESEFGAKITDEYKKQYSLVEDSEVLEYVNGLGKEVAQFMGREFDYEFIVVRDNSVNAFALPGGKIFVNTGAILAANSQAELAGLLAHEAAHSVMSHNIQGMLRGNALGQLSNQIPFGDFVTKMVDLRFNRGQERRADMMGTRVLARAGYAADGLRNFMATLSENSESQIEYFSTHPNPKSRVQYLEEFIQRNGYNRYALEGVDKHAEIQKKLGS
ncbi:MAG: M48 family metalloprotease [Microcoleaceae cyanobacterium]